MEDGGPLRPPGDDDLVGLGEPWTRVHRRVWETPGAIVDLGCAGWDWTRRFFGKKRVLGVDPFEDDPRVEGVDLFRGVVSSVRGTIKISREGNGSSTRSLRNAVDVEALTLADLLDRYRVDRVSALKINTEGSEYEILVGMPEELFDRIDQIAVSFHDFAGLGSRGATAAVLSYLGNFYDARAIDDRWGWHLLTRRRAGRRVAHARRPARTDPAPAPKRLALVTGILDLGQREERRRSVEEYMRWATYLWSLEQDVVFFVEPKLEDKVAGERARRGLSDRTLVVPVALEDFACYKDRAGEARRGLRPRNGDPIKDTPAYFGLMWSKFEMLDRALALDPFRSSHLAWIDFGLPHVARMTSPALTEPFDDPSDAFKIHVLRYFDSADVRAPDYWAWLRGHVAAGFMVGRADAVRRTIALFWRGLDAALAAGFTPVDEMVLPHAVCEDPGNFAFSYGGYPDILRNHVRMRGGSEHIAFQMRDARERKAWRHGCTLGAQAVESYEQGLFDAPAAAMEQIVMEYYIAAYYSISRAKAGEVADYYARLASADPAFRAAFERHAGFVRSNFAHLQRSVALP